MGDGRTKRGTGVKNPGFSEMVSSMFGGDAGKRPGGAHARLQRRTRLKGELYLPALWPAVLLTLYGLVVVWSASLSISDASLPRQLLGVALGLAAALILWRYDYRDLANYTTALLVLDIVLWALPLVPGLGYSAKGMSGWIQVPGIGLRVQPSEIMKLVTIYYMAGLGAQYNGRIGSFREYCKLCGMLLVPFVLLLTQDLGTSLVVLVAGAAIIICAGARKEWVIPTILLIVVGAGLVVWQSVAAMEADGIGLLKAYQVKRLIVFVDPSVDPSGDGYNLQQAKIAVGSGGLFGKGIGNASQAGGGFLPEAHTDFVFALLAEEFGFLGVVLLLGLFAWLLFATVALAQKMESPFAKLVLVGVVAMWSFQLLENVGMCTGIMPITGIPLPFISYGASSMVVQLTAVGMVQSVYRHRTKAA
ncbi:FtsW/RodA/SpoVE family cell cycle protein [Olsenella sp. YH-ols2217]|uniref:FtsW/RodA/SpoVE family cell cycle protein n=1 Tax=Kribbibacterium absianum TaxID=3044210 RepID=A0ABT6ZJG7_9ACTN|nr:MULTISPECIES: FtsW/RodA/SpoVE family cell cycle protein [unclassified Olsenella]MDJ1121552.1 FtsW/RodA/SpoVE family cell cycle protein [Olsenella sp. YH-ols2216]MDJ1129042.1 FtsW/RodA/SpoVE family cell cycle protein [Olsenella sp. YH-ols2217]